MNLLTKTAVVTATLLALSAPAFAAPTATAAAPAAHAKVMKKSATTARAAHRAAVARPRKSH
jgi:hypothetical protein